MNTKTAIALVLVVAVAFVVAAIGIAYAQYATTTPTPNGTTGGAPATGFLSWMGRCLGFRGAYYGTSTTPNQPLNITVTDPNTGTTRTYQSYGYGSCMRGFVP